MHPVARTPRDLVKAKAKTRIDLTIPKVKVKLSMIIVRRQMERDITKLKVKKVKDAGGEETQMVTPRPPQLNRSCPIPLHSQTQHNRWKNGNQKTKRNHYDNR